MNEETEREATVAVDKSRQEEVECVMALGMFVNYVTCEMSF